MRLKFLPLKSRNFIRGPRNSIFSQKNRVWRFFFSKYQINKNIRCIWRMKTASVSRASNRSVRWSKIIGISRWNWQYLWNWKAGQEIARGRSDEGLARLFTFLSEKGEKFQHMWTCARVHARARVCACACVWRTYACGGTRWCTLFDIQFSSLRRIDPARETTYVKEPRRKVLRRSGRFRCIREPITSGELVGFRKKINYWTAVE